MATGPAVSDVDDDAGARAELAASVLVSKSVCVHRYDDVLAEASTPEELVDGVAQRVVRTLVEDTRMHGDWYALRQLSTFDATLRPTVEAVETWLEEMVWRIVTRYADLSGRAPAVTAPIAYKVLDDIFEASLNAETLGIPGAADELEAQVRHLMPMMLGERVPRVPRPRPAPSVEARLGATG